MAVRYCKPAWEETDDAIGMTELETCLFTHVHQSPTPVEGANDDEAHSNNSSRAVGALERRRGTGSVFPSRFRARLQDQRPSEYFGEVFVGGHARYVCHTDSKKILVYADGACPNNGQPGARAGWGVVFGPAASGDQNLAYGRLEDHGPFGDQSIPTSNRAELRAVIAALRLRNWQTDGFNNLVIATDSSYVVDGATNWVKGWLRNGWTTRNHQGVKNRDLWELLLGEVERSMGTGLGVALWHIPRELNTDADAAAKKAADIATASAEFIDVTAGTSVTDPARQTAAPDPRVLIICLDYEKLFDSVFDGLVTQITSKATVERANTAKTALAKLQHLPRQTVILIVDGALTRRREIWERVIDCLRGGATVVLAGCFSSMVNAGQFHRFFAKLGLGWKPGSYRRTDLSLVPAAAGAQLSEALPPSYSAKCVFMKGIEQDAAWYIDADGFGDAAVAFTRVGKGHLGYIGDVNGESSSEAVVLAMCGLLVPRPVSIPEARTF